MGACIRLCSVHGCMHAIVVLVRNIEMKPFLIAEGKNAINMADQSAVFQGDLIHLWIINFFMVLSLWK